MRIIQPQVDHHPGTVLLLSNEYATDLDHGLDRHSAALANFTGYSVCAYDRLGTGKDPRRFSLSLRTELDPSRVISSNVALARKIGAELDANGLTKAISAGHSAAGTQAIVLTRTELLPVSDLVVTEPVAIRSLSVVGGFLRHASYNHRFEGASTLPSANLPLKDVISEIFHYSGLWASNFSLQALKEIVQTQPEVRASVVFGDPSLSGNTAFIMRLVENVSTQGPNQLKVSIRPNTLHSAFSRAEVLGDVILKAVSS